MKIYNTTSKEVEILDASNDVLGNMNIFGEGTGIYKVSDDEETQNADDVAAFKSGCHAYGDENSIAWWRAYDEGISDIEKKSEEIEDLLKDLELEKLDEIAKVLELEVGRYGGDWQIIPMIVRWMVENAVDYEDEHAAFLSRYEQVKELL